MFEGKYDILTERDGKALYDWANTGDAPAQRSKPNTIEPIVTENENEAEFSTPLEKAISEINELAKELAGSGVTKAKISGVVKQISGSANYNKITELDVASKVYKALISLKNEEE